MSRTEYGVVMMIVGIIAGAWMVWTLFPETSPLNCTPPRNDAQMLNGYNQ